VRFWFTPVDPIGLHIVRVLTGLLFLAWLLPLAGQENALFGLHGWFDRQAYQESTRLAEELPQPIGWSVLYWCGANPALVTAAYWLSVAVAVALTAGLWPRLTAPGAWVIAASFTANPALVDDADCLVTVLLFYLMIGYLFTALRGRRPRAGAGQVAGETTSRSANIAFRLLQVHFAIIMVASGTHKLQFSDWWAGLALWYPLHPPSATALDEIRQLAPHANLYLALLGLGGYAALAWQIAFPVFAWRRRWRWLLLGGALLSWLATRFIYEIPLLGPAMVIACLSYLAPEEWRAWGSRLAKLGGFRTSATGRPIREVLGRSLTPAAETLDSLEPR
jgi:hypothetical protein